MVSRAAAGAIAASLVLVGLVLVMALGDDPSGRPDGTGTAPPTLVLPDEPDAEAQAGAQRGPRLRLQPVARFARPVWLTQPPGDPPRLFVVEKGGRVRIVRGGRVLRRPFLSLRGKVSTRTEQGLLSLAFAPSYTRSRRFYVSYTDRRGALRVEEWRTRRSSPDRADPDSRRLVIRIPQP
uniref:PQQ-dependent sugar dehydrogenase n=1 Tax=Paraconexibacter sp. TaxID=2949640 RepID=UPI003561FA09